MGYNNVKVKPRQTVTQSTSQTKELGIVSEVPMGDWNAVTQYEKLNKVRYVSTGGSGVTLLAKKQNQGVEPFVSQGWQEVWMVENYDGGAVIPNGTYPEMTVGNATNAQNDGNGENIANQFADINDKIPSTASSENQLADKAFVNSSINAMAAFYITSNAQGDAFPTRTDLLNATTFYSGGEPRVPTQNDYAIVRADESQPQSVDGSYPTTRYSYQGGTYPNGQWDFQYVVNNTSLTQAQINAINSGITAPLVSNIFPPNTSTPLMDGTASAGTSNTYARGNHRHPTDTTRASTAVATQTSNGLMSSEDKTKLDSLKIGNNYATCSTNASTAAKVVSKEGFILVVGERITVKFTYANTTNSPTLNVNDTGAIPINADGDPIYVKWPVDTVMEFVYDGDYWVCLAGYPLQGKRVGNYYFSNNNASPATLYGGSWSAISSGYYLKAITSGTPAYGDAGLPNITGTFRYGVTGRSFLNAENLSGAFTGSNPQTASVTVGAAGSSVNADISFNANNGASTQGIYGNSTTVTPKNHGAYMWYRTA